MGRGNVIPPPKEVDKLVVRNVPRSVRVAPPISGCRLLREAGGTYDSRIEEWGSNLSKFGSSGRCLC